GRGGGAVDAAGEIELAGLGEHDRRGERDPQVAVDAELGARGDPVARLVELELAAGRQRRQRIAGGTDLLARDRRAVGVVLVVGLEPDQGAGSGGRGRGHVARGGGGARGRAG